MFSQFASLRYLDIFQSNSHKAFNRHFVNIKHTNIKDENSKHLIFL